MGSMQLGNYLDATPGALRAAVNEGRVHDWIGLLEIQPEETGTPDVRYELTRRGEAALEAEEAGTDDS